MNYKLYLLTNTFKQHEIDQIQFREIQRIQKQEDLNCELWKVISARITGFQTSMLMKYLKYHKTQARNLVVNL